MAEETTPPLTAKIVSRTRAEVGTIELPHAVFGEPLRRALLADVVRMQTAGRRAGTAATKEKGEVRGGGKKPWKQKGTGRARAGSIRSPLWAGGGTIFGPHPRDYAYAMPKRARQAALRSALAQKLREERLTIVDRIELPETKTKHFAAWLERSRHRRQRAGGHRGHRPADRARRPQPAEREGAAGRRPQRLRSAALPPARADARGRAGDRRAGGGMKREYNLIAAPLITEKGTFVNEIGNQVVFQVRPDANKLEIKHAVERLFKVKVLKVRTANMLGKIATGGALARPAAALEEGLRDPRRGPAHRFLRAGVEHAGHHL